MSADFFNSFYREEVSLMGKASFPRKYVDVSQPEAVHMPREPKGVFSQKAQEQPKAPAQQKPEAPKQNVPPPSWVAEQGGPKTPAPGWMGSLETSAPSSPEQEAAAPNRPQTRAELGRERIGQIVQRHGFEPTGGNMDRLKHNSISAFAIDHINDMQQQLRGVDRNEMLEHTRNALNETHGPEMGQHLWDAYYRPNINLQWGEEKQVAKSLEHLDLQLANIDLVELSKSRRGDEHLDPIARRIKMIIRRRKGMK